MAFNPLKIAWNKRFRGTAYDMRADLAAEDSVHGDHGGWSRLRRMEEVR